MSVSLKDLLNLLPGVRHSPNADCGLAYYEEGDVLYVHFGLQPRPATDSELTDRRQYCAL